MRNKTREELDDIETRLRQLECPHGNVHFGLVSTFFVAKYRKTCVDCGKVGVC